MQPVASLIRAIALLAGLAAAAPALRALPVAVDLELVLAVDVSRSVDDEEYELQKQGYIEAFNHPAVQSAIQANPHRRIAVKIVEWAGADFQKVVVPWTVTGDAESGQLFGDALRQVQYYSLDVYFIITVMCYLFLLQKQIAY